MSAIYFGYIDMGTHVWGRGRRSKATNLCLNLYYNKTVTLKYELSRPVGCDLQGSSVMALEFNNSVCIIICTPALA